MWPSVRLGLLSPNKYVAIVNTLSKWDLASSSFSLMMLPIRYRIQIVADEREASRRSRHDRLAEAIGERSIEALPCSDCFRSDRPPQSESRRRSNEWKRKLAESISSVRFFEDYCSQFSSVTYRVPESRRARARTATVRASRRSLLCRVTTGTVETCVVEMVESTRE